MFTFSFVKFAFYSEICYYINSKFKGCIMKRNKIVSFIISMLFTMSFCSFGIYLYYYFKLKNTVNKDVITLMQLSIVNYRNIALFCLIIGLFIVLVRSIIEYIFMYKENSVTYEPLTKISTRNKTEYLVMKDTEIKSTSNMVNTLLKDKILKVKFIDSDTNDRIVRFSKYNEKSNVLELIDISDEDKVKKDSILYNLNSDRLMLCDVCKNMISKDSNVCIHCGEVIKKEKKQVFNPVKLVLNMILILLLIILILLVINKIDYKYKNNSDNLNINIEEKNN